jgi:predicted MFS family arabinose efflux permease
MQKLRPILLASFFFSIQLALVAYINSSMLGSFLTPKGTSIVYTLSAALSLILVSRVAKLVARYGAVKYMATVLGVSAALLLLLGVTSSHIVAVLFFIPYFALSSLVFYGFDLFLEHFSHPNTTGKTRGTYLALTNVAWVGMPAFVGFLESRYGFGIVYIFAAFAVVSALIVILLGERQYQDPKYVPLSLRRMMRVLRTKKDVRGSIIINLLLQLFYVWMVIYSPLYLTRTLGFSWASVGAAFSIMLIPFMLFQYPAGRIADRFSNEREMIAGGLLIMGIATMIFSLSSGTSIVAIALILFLTRVGASIVEVSNDSYFFKHVDDTDNGTIAVYRNMYPLAYLIGPVLAVILLGWSMYAVLFFILGIIMLGGAVFALTLHDVKKPEQEPDDKQIFAK